MIIRTVNRFVLTFTLFVLASLSLAGFFSGQDKVAELLSHLRLAYTLLLFLNCLLFVVLREFKFACLSGIIFIVNAADVVRVYMPENHRHVSTHSKSIKFLIVNVESGNNSDVSSFLKLVDQKDPDFIALSEVNQFWIDALNSKLKAFPYHSSTQLIPYDGMAFYSKIKVENIEVRHAQLAGRARFYGFLELDSKRIGFTFAHPLLPLVLLLRNEELDAIANDAKTSHTPFLVMGDLNCTPWSCYFDKLLKDGGLHDTERGFAPQPTYDGRSYIPLLPIDHCLTTNEFTVKRREVGPRFGSDHLPLFVELDYDESQPM